ESWPRAGAQGTSSAGTNPIIRAATTRRSLYIDRPLKICGGWVPRKKFHCYCPPCILTRTVSDQISMVFDASDGFGTVMATAQEQVTRIVCPLVLGEP